MLSLYGPVKVSPIIADRAVCVSQRGPLADVDIGCYSSNRGPSDQIFSSHFGGDGALGGLCPTGSD